MIKRKYKKTKTEKQKLRRQSFTCTIDEWLWLQKTAEEHNMSVCQLVRRLIMKLMNDNV